jgi:hypothetical protein
VSDSIEVTTRWIDGFDTERKGCIVRVRVKSEATVKGTFIMVQNARLFLLPSKEEEEK